MATLTTQNCNSRNIYANDPNTGYTNNTYDIVGNANKRVILYQFDVSEIGKAIVSNASLKLRAISGSSQTMTTTIYKLRRTDWSYNQATWNIYKTGSNWGMPGASSTTSDINTSLAAGLSISLPNPNTVLSTSIANIVQDAIDNNNGIVNLSIQQSGVLSNYSKNIAGTTNTTTAYRPTLEIDYEPAPLTNASFLYLMV